MEKKIKSSVKVLLMQEGERRKGCIPILLDPFSAFGIQQCLLRYGATAAV